MPKTAHVATGAAVVFTGFVVWIVSAWSRGTSIEAVNDIVFVVLSISGAIFAAFAARAVHGRLRAAWIAMTIGMVGWALGEVLWAYYALALDEPPFPSLADAAYLIMPIGFCVGLLLFPADTGQSRSRTRFVWTARCRRKYPRAINAGLSRTPGLWEEKWSA